MIRNWDRQTGRLVTSGDHFLQGRKSTAAGVYHRLRMFFGEYFLDISQGTPWFQSILGKNPQDVAEAAIKERIITAPDVVAITDFSFDMNSQERRIVVDATVLDINSEAVRILLDEDII